MILSSTDNPYSHLVFLVPCLMVFITDVSILLFTYLYLLMSFKTVSIIFTGCIYLIKWVYSMQCMGMQ